MTGRTVVSLRGITKCYGDLRVSDGIDLDILEGEFLTLLGSSGSGKTTLMRIVAGLEFCDSGTVLLQGKDVTGLPPRHRNVGMVFQQYSLFPHMTVAENVSYGLTIRGWKGADVARRVKEMLEMVRLPEVVERYPHQLSGGQQQRVALARALASSPQILMLDEPLGALDLKLRKQLQMELKRIHREAGTTFLFVTHDQDEALSMSDRVAVLRSGRIEQIGGTREIYESPKTAYVADFIGEVTLMPCVLGERGQAVVKGSTCEIPAPPNVQARSFDLAVRPEHVRLHADPQADGLPGRVTDVHFEGGSSIVQVELDVGPVLKARILGMPDRAMQPGIRVWARVVGATVGLPSS